MTEVLTPSQRAREAAASLAICSELADAVLAGQFDGHIYTQAFARFESECTAAASEELEMVRAENARLREALESLVAKWESNSSEGDEWEDGYEDALAECARIARDALNDAPKQGERA